MDPDRNEFVISPLANAVVIGPAGSCKSTTIRIYFRKNARVKFYVLNFNKATDDSLEVFLDKNSIRNVAHSTLDSLFATGKEHCTKEFARGESTIVKRPELWGTIIDNQACFYKLVGCQCVVIDEAQDLKRDEYTAMCEAQRVLGFNLILMGDPDQCVYKFRGAEPQAMMEYASRPDVRNFFFQRNYRSTPLIIAIANPLRQEGLAIYPESKGDPEPQGKVLLHLMNDHDLAEMILGVFQRTRLKKSLCVIVATNDQQANLRRLLGSACKLDGAEDNKTEINLRTRHTSKGLTIDVVILAYYNEPHKSVISTTRESTERSVTYVAFSRPREELILHANPDEPVHRTYDLIKDHVQVVGEGKVLLTPPRKPLLITRDYKFDASRFIGFPYDDVLELVR